jgi:hypothetical protein
MTWQVRELFRICLASLAGLALAWWCEAELFAHLFALAAAFTGEEAVRRTLKLRFSDRKVRR